MLIPETVSLPPRPNVSIVICVYNEAGNSAPLVEQIRRAMQGVYYELIYVNDGSTDQTLAELRAINDPNLIILDLQKNYGQSLALAAGIDVARGTYVVTLDGDQQNDPADIMSLVKHCDVNDLDLVTGLRANRQDGYWLRQLPSQLANTLIRWATGVQLQDMGCGLKVFRADLAKNLNLYGELHRFILVLAHLEGARMAQMQVNHRPRQIGQSKYGLGRTFRVISDLLLMLFLKKYLRKPMHLFGTTGVLMICAGTTALAISLVHSRMSFQTFPIFVPLAGLIIIVSGIQLLVFGIMAEIQSRIYFESQGKKPYQVRRIYTPGILMC